MRHGVFPSAFFLSFHYTSAAKIGGREFSSSLTYILLTSKIHLPRHVHIGVHATRRIFFFSPFLPSHAFHAPIPERRERQDCNVPGFFFVAPRVIVCSPMPNSCCCRIWRILWRGWWFHHPSGSPPPPYISGPARFTRRRISLWVDSGFMTVLLICSCCEASGLAMEGRVANAWVAEIISGEKKLVVCGGCIFLGQNFRLRE